MYTCKVLFGYRTGYNAKPIRKIKYSNMRIFERFVCIYHKSLFFILNRNLISH